MNDRIARAERLITDYRMMSSVATATRQAVTVTRTAGDLPVAYTVELRIQTISSLDNQGEPVFARPVRLNIVLPTEYPDRASRCRLASQSSAVFHPHFSPPRGLGAFFTGAEWIDYQPYDSQEGLASLVLRIARSLQYQLEYVKQDAARPANEQAMEWFRRQLRDGSAGFFPVDQTPLPNPHEFRATSAPIAEVDSEQPRDQGVTPRSKSFTILPRGGAAPGQSTAETDVSAPAKVFRVGKVAQRFSPSVRPAGQFRTDPGLASERRETDPPGYELYLQPGARRQVFEHIGWGQSTTENRCEQGGLLIGRVFLDRARNTIYAVIEHVVRGDTARGEQAHLEMNHATWNSMVERADAHRDAHPGMQIVGWYHTHPNALDVFMSETDLATQRMVFSEPWQCAIVLNPHRMIWRAFAGADARECRGFVVCDEASAPSAIAEPARRASWGPTWLRRVLDTILYDSRACS